MRGASFVGALGALALTIFACGDDAGSGASDPAVDGGGSSGNSSTGGDGSGPANDGGATPTTIGWVKVFATNELSPVHLAAMPNGDVIVTMRFEGMQIDFEKAKLDSAGSWDTAVLRIAADGTVLWVVAVSGSQADDIGDVAVDPSGDVFIAGSYHGDGVNVAGTYAAGLAGRLDDDGFFARLDGATGAAKWVRTWTLQSGPDDRYVHCDGVSAPTTASVSFRCSVKSGMLAYPGGTIDVTGLKGFIGAFDPATGDVTWSMTESTAFVGEGIMEDPSGDVLLVSGSASFSGSQLSKVSKQTKTVVWQKTYADLDFFDTPVQAADGSIFLRGYTERAPNQQQSDKEAFVLKVDSTGTEQWRKVFGSPGFDLVRGLALNGAGAVVGVGDSDSRDGPSTIDGRTLVPHGEGFFLTTFDPVTGAALSATGFTATEGISAEDVAVTSAGTIVAGLADGDFVLDKPRTAAGVGSVFVALFK